MTKKKNLFGIIVALILMLVAGCGLIYDGLEVFLFGFDRPFMEVWFGGVEIIGGVLIVFLSYVIFCHEFNISNPLFEATPPTVNKVPDNAPAEVKPQYVDDPDKPIMERLDGLIGNINERIYSMLKEDDQDEQIESLRTILGHYRMIKAEIEIAMTSGEKKESLTKEEEVKTLMGMVEKHNKSINAYRKGNRLDLVEKEEHELQTIFKFIPEPPSQEEVQKDISEMIAHLVEEKGADYHPSMRDFKPINAELSKKYPTLDKTTIRETYMALIQ